MRILNTQQIRELDAYTISHEPIASIDLMERAARAFVDWFTMRIDTLQKVGIVCGTGNNGGDGLAIARMLHEWGYNVTVWIARGGAESEDFVSNLRRLPERVGRLELTAADGFSFEGCQVLVDAIFGSGLSRAPGGLYAGVIDAMNNFDALRVAVDVPSGLMADSVSPGSIVKADYTVSFQVPKLAFFLPQSHPFTGEWVIVNIGLDRDFIKQLPTPYFYTRLKDVQRLLKRRSKFDHKGTFGHALLISGSRGKMGAAVLSARAALRAGLGLLSVHVPECGYQIMQTSVPEAMAHVDVDYSLFTNPPSLAPYGTLGIGPGLGQDDRTVQALRRTLESFQNPLVLDADALNILAANRDMLALVPPGSILTPHPGEFARLTGPWTNDFQRLELQKQLAVSLKAVVVLKGAYTSVATDKGEIHFNSTGNPGMATGGSGDVLTGILTGLLAQKYSPVEAAVIGVFLHGLAGDLAVAQSGPDSLIASDLIDNLSSAFLKIGRR